MPAHEVLRGLASEKSNGVPSASAGAFEHQGEGGGGGRLFSGACGEHIDGPGGCGPIEADPHLGALQRLSVS